jgi:hypothetical protein
MFSRNHPGAHWAAPFLSGLETFGEERRNQGLLPDSLFSLERRRRGGNITPATSKGRLLRCFRSCCPFAATTEFNRARRQPARRITGIAPLLARL